MSVMGLLSDVAMRLVRQGYPESVAERIASGELPMDTASRMQRARQLGFDPDDVQYHGTSADFTEFRPSEFGNVGPGVYMSRNPDVASSYASPAREGMREGAQVMPLLTRGETIIDKDYFAQNPDTRLSEMADLNARLREQGITNIQEAPSAPDRAVFDPRDIRSLFSGAFDPEYTGPNILGATATTAGALGLLAAPEEAEAGFITRGGRGLLEAFHGSPHKFDKFSMDQIGTGEGAQAYGHGLYFADNVDVAREYRDNLKDWDSVFEMNNRLAELQSEIDGASGAKLKKLVSEYEQVAEARELVMNDPGALYRTEINVPPESLLDWDKPLSEQPNALRAFQEIYSDEAMRLDPEILGPLYSNPADVDMATLGLFDKSKGAQAYNTIKDMNYVRGAPAMSEKLREKGIQGIKYLDGDSRAVGDGTSNYVIFDDSLINIAERGVADPRLLGGTALGTAGILGAIAAGDRDNTAMAASPRSDTLQDITMGLRDVERRLEGSPASLLFPEGVVNYLETVNRPYEDPTALTRAMALLDFL